MRNRSGLATTELLGFMNCLEPARYATFRLKCLSWVWAIELPH